LSFLAGATIGIDVWQSTFLFKRKFTHDNRIKSKIADYFIFCIENCNFQINILIFFSALS